MLPDVEVLKGQEWIEAGSLFLINCQIISAWKCHSSSVPCSPPLFLTLSSSPLPFPDPASFLSLRLFLLCTYLILTDFLCLSFTRSLPDYPSIFFNFSEHISSSSLCPLSCFLNMFTVSKQMSCILFYCFVAFLTKASFYFQGDLKFVV